MIDGKNLHIALIKPSLNLPRDHPRYTPTAFTCAGEIRGVAEDGHFRHIAHPRYSGRLAARKG